MYIRQIAHPDGSVHHQSPAGMDGITNGDYEDRFKGAPKLQIGTSVLRFEYEQPDEFFVERAREELRETPEVVEQALKDIRVLLKGEPELFVPDDDEFYTKFLRPCKWYPKSAFELMKRFYKFKLSHQKVCQDLVPSKVKKVLCANLYIPLPDRMENGSRVLLINAGKHWNPKKISTEDLFKTAMISLDAAMAEPRTQIAGVHVIFNMEGFSLSQVTYITPSFAAMVADWVQRCLPCRLKGIHIVNQPFIFNMVFAIFKPFLQEKTRKRIHFHGTDRAPLLAYLGRKPLPTTLDGELILPDAPIGDGIWEYLAFFEKDFEDANVYGYRKNVK